MNKITIYKKGQEPVVNELEAEGEAVEKIFEEQILGATEPLVLTAERDGDEENILIGFVAAERVLSVDAFVELRMKMLELGEFPGFFHVFPGTFSTPVQMENGKVILNMLRGYLEDPTKIISPLEAMLGGLVKMEELL